MIRAAVAYAPCVLPFSAFLPCPRQPVGEVSSQQHEERIALCMLDAHLRRCRQTFAATAYVPHRQKAAPGCLTSGPSAMSIMAERSNRMPDIRLFRNVNGHQPWQLARNMLGSTSVL
eukprot:scaffold136957_cov18-Tisochrysis_lutea.AAC.4